MLANNAGEEETPWKGRKDGRAGSRALRQYILMPLPGLFLHNLKVGKRVLLFRYCFKYRKVKVSLVE